MTEQPPEAVNEQDPESDRAMNEREPDSLSCDSVRESWLAAESHAQPEPESTSLEFTDAGLPAPVAEHLSSCAGCQEFRQQVAGDQARLRAHFLAIAIPTPPEIVVRGALDAASGYPRRTSLTLLPFFWALLLGLGVVGILAALLWIFQNTAGAAGI